MRRALAGAAVGLLLLAGEAAAQGDCFPPTDSHEAETFGITSVPLAFSPLRAPRTGSRTTVEFGLEGATVANPDSVTRTPTICRPGKGAERTDFLFAVPRPRVGVQLPSGFGFELSWIPPLRLSGVRANLLSIAVGRIMPVGGVLLGLRAHATVGLIRAPITCDTDALADPVSECFGGTRSDDRFHPNIFGADATVGLPVARGRVHPYLGAGYSVLHPRFQVNFTNSQGTTDNRKVEVNLQRVVAFGGVGWTPAASWELTGEVYASLGDAVSARLGVRKAVTP